MAAKTLKVPVNQLYDEDFAVWTEEMARLLRERRFDEADIEHLAEEIEDMGKRDSREVFRRARLILMHVLKWKFQPEARSGSWMVTINTQRRDLLLVLKDSPSLKRKLRDSAPEVYADAVKDASGDTGLPRRAFPTDCPFPLEDILNSEFLPE